MKKYILTLIVSLSCISLVAQNNIRVDPDHFTGVIFSSKYTAYIHPSETKYVMVSGDNLYDENVIVDVKNGILSVTFEETYDGLEVHVFTPTLNYIQISGTVELKTKAQLPGETLDIKMSGASEFKGDLNYKKINMLTGGSPEINLTGNVDSLFIKCAGASDINTAEMTNKYASITATGASDVNVNPTNVLLADLSGASSLKYKSEPAIKKVNEKSAVWYGLSDGTPIDTTRIEGKNGKVTITGKYNSDNLNIDNTTPKKKKQPDFYGNWTGLEIGFAGYLTSDNKMEMPASYEYMDLKYPSSLLVNFNFYQQSLNLFKNKLGLVTGAGIRAVSYHFDDDVVLTSDSIFSGVHEADINKDYIKSKMVTSYLTVPLLLEFQTNPDHNLNSFHLSAGVIGGLRIATYTKTVFNTTSGSKTKPKVKDDFYLMPYVLDATVRIGWDQLNLYATYSLVEMFKENKGPELYPISLGLSFMM